MLSSVVEVHRVTGRSYRSWWLLENQVELQTRRTPIMLRARPSSTDFRWFAIVVVERG
jgi:hypothetical protein